VARRGRSRCPPSQPQEVKGYNYGIKATR
jgi:hypothetical protein